MGQFRLGLFFEATRGSGCGTPTRQFQGRVVKLLTVGQNVEHRQMKQQQSNKIPPSTWVHHIHNRHLSISLCSHKGVVFLPPSSDRRCTVEVWLRWAVEISQEQRLTYWPLRRKSQGTCCHHDSVQFTP